MIVKKYLAKIEKIINPIEGVYTIWFTSTSKFKFKPGQFLHLAIDALDPSSPWPESRCFSIQTAPEEGNRLAITYSIVGSFTKRMEKELSVGKEIWLKLPYGEIFQGDHDISNTVFIAGGTGVTPFLSLFTSEEFSSYKNPTLYLGVREQKFHLYQEELNRAKKINETFRDELVVGILDIQKIFTAHGSGATYFISGPPKMISLFKECLIAKGVAAVRVITDDWG